MKGEELYKEPIYGFEDKVLDELFREKPPLEIAEKGLRFINYLIDYAVLFFFMLFIMMIMGGLINYFEGVNGSTILTNTQDWIIGIVFLIGLCSYFYYFVIFECYMDGKTIGKMVTKTKVVTTDGEEPTLWNIIGRTICRYIPMEPISFLFSDYGGLHDKLSKTIVVKDV